MNEGITSFGAISLAAATRDLKAPLVRLRQLSFQLEDDQLANANVSASAALNRLRLTVDEALLVVDQLSQLSTIDTGQLSLEPIQLNGLCQTVADKSAGLCRELGQQLVCELPRRQPMIAVADYRILRALLQHFAGDALRYNDDVRPVKLTVRLCRSGQTGAEAVIAISDHGPELDRRRSDNLIRAVASVATIAPLASRPLMSSLNLLLADRLARAMNGSVVLRRRRGAGLTIETRLPLSHQLSLLEVG